MLDGRKCWLETPQVTSLLKHKSCGCPKHLTPMAFQKPKQWLATFFRANNELTSKWFKLMECWRHFPKSRFQGFATFWMEFVKFCKRFAHLCFMKEFEQTAHIKSYWSFKTSFCCISKGSFKLSVSTRNAKFSPKIFHWNKGLKRTPTEQKSSTVSQNNNTSLNFKQSSPWKTKKFRHLATLCCLQKLFLRSVL